jgi:hypothetical protein
MTRRPRRRNPPAREPTHLALPRVRVHERTVKYDRPCLLNSPHDPVEVVGREPKQDTIASGGVVRIAKMRVLVGLPWWS